MTQIEPVNGNKEREAPDLRDRPFACEHAGMIQAFSLKDGACLQHAFAPLAAMQAAAALAEGGGHTAAGDGGDDEPADAVRSALWAYVGLAPFTVALAGRAHGGLPAIATAQTELSREMKLSDIREDIVEFGNADSASRLTLVFRHEATGLEIQVEHTFIPGCAVLRSVTRAVNRSERPLTLTHLSSAYLQGIALSGCRAWHDPEKIRLHYAKQTWAGEGQWRQTTLEEADLYRTATHSDRSAFHLSGEGSWSTSRYAPMIVVEDREAGQVWYAQIETSSPWHLEIGVRGSIWEEGERAMYLQADGATERNGGWARTLAPGESFESAPVAAGCCEGGFEDAVRELTRYRRTCLKLSVPVFGQSPVVYNDYMNGIWANPSIHNLPPLIDAAAEAGAEVYCIDAGWFTGRGDKPGRNLGDWEPHPDKFGPEGLSGILHYIRSRGLVPGIWLEMEVCGEHAELGRQPDEWFLRLDGRRVGGGERWFLNFAHKSVRDYLHGVIDRLTDMGVGFIKNDYNACAGPGDNHLGTTPADGLLRNARAFYAFIDEVRERHPDLILENCGCGAMRLDYGIQAHFHSSSFSDQENYTLSTSIMAGTLAFMLPEQTGIWAYPFPLIIQHNGQEEVLESEAYLSAQVDGEQTIYNLVNALCGAVTLSGRIDKADARNLALIQEGIRLHKQERGSIERSYPIWPLGMPRIGGSGAWASVGLISEDRSRLLLAVWRRETASSCCEIPLPDFRGSRVSVRQLYPSGEEYRVQTVYNRSKGALTVSFPKMNQARFFEIRR